MHKLVLTLTLAIGLLAASCGDDAATDTVSDDPPDTTTTIDDAPINDAPVDDPVADPGSDGPILGAGPYPIADLTITVTLTEGGATTISRLACLGDTATVTGDPGPASADMMCLALNDPSINDRVVNGAPVDIACTEQYGGPEVAAISGTLDGAEIDTSFDRTNGCGIGDWELMRSFLPTPG